MEREREREREGGREGRGEREREMLTFFHVHLHYACIMKTYSGSICTYIRVYSEMTSTY